MAKRKTRLRLGKREKEILNLIAKLSFVSASIVAPGIAEFYPIIFKNKNPQQKYYINKKIKDLSRNDIIILGGDEIQLTEKGKHILAHNIEFEPQYNQDSWNGVWQIIAYDIPNNKTIERNHFRHKLYEAGFVCFQKSLWVFPYECQEDVAILAQSLGLSPFVVYMRTNKLPNEIKYLKHFNLEEDFEK